MKPFFAGLGAALVVGLSPLAATAPAPGVPDTATERQLRELEQAWVTAENNQDVATLGRILDDRFISTFGTGEPSDKEAFITMVTAGAPDPTLTQTLGNVTIRVAGDTAIVVGTDTVSRIKEGKTVTTVLRYTVTYIRRGERWVALAEHMVRVPPAK